MPPKRKREVEVMAGSSKASPDLATVKSAGSSSKAKRAKLASATAVEKRGAIFKKKCPNNISERVERVRTQRFFMVDRRREDDALKEEFSVLGSTGNVYTVIIGHRPSCDCPDATKGNHCKHILFVYLKVLQVPSSSGHWYQKALLTSELEEIFRNAPLAPNHVTNPRLQELFAKATNKTPSTSEPSPSQNRKIPGEDDDCPICYETMHKTPEKDLIFCEAGCGNALHQVCFGQWRATQKAKRVELTCVWCRAKWQSSGPLSDNVGAAAGPTNCEGYLNLGSAAGLSPVRDTSTYHRWHSDSRRRRYHEDLYEEEEDGPPY